MKKYSSKKCIRGKTAYRTPSVFRHQKHIKVSKAKLKGKR